MSGDDIWDELTAREPIDARTLRLVIEDQRSWSRRWVYPVLRPLANVFVAVAVVLRRFVPGRLTAHGLMDALCVWFLRRCVSPAAGELLVRHFIVETNLLVFVARNAGMREEVTLRPRALAALKNRAVIEHDVNVYEVLKAVGPRTQTLDTHRPTVATRTEALDTHRPTVATRTQTLDTDTTVATRTQTRDTHRPTVATRAQTLDTDTTFATRTQTRDTHRPTVAARTQTLDAHRPTVATRTQTLDTDTTVAARTEARDTHTPTVATRTEALDTSGTTARTSTPGLDTSMLSVETIDAEPHTRRIMRLDIQSALCLMNIPFALCLNAHEYRRAVQSLRLDSHLMAVLADITGDPVYRTWAPAGVALRVDSRLEVPRAVYEHAVICEYAHERLLRSAAVPASPRDDGPEPARRQNDALEPAQPRRNAPDPAQLQHDAPEPPPTRDDPHPAHLQHDARKPAPTRDATHPAQPQHDAPKPATVRRVAGREEPAPV